MWQQQERENGTLVKNAHHRSRSSWLLVQAASIVDAGPATSSPGIQAATTDSKRYIARSFVVRLSKSPKEGLQRNSFYYYADPEELGQQGMPRVLVFSEMSLVGLFLL